MSLFMMIGGALIILAMAISLTALVWQLVEAFKTGVGWGVFSVIGLCLGWLPNLIYCIVHWDKGWRILVTSLGSLLPLFAGYAIVMFELAVQAMYSSV